MDPSWYVLDQKTTPESVRGPYDRSQITVLITRGLVTRESLVARVGRDDWSPASSDTELATIISGAPLVSPPVSPPTEEAFSAPDAPRTWPEASVTSAESNHGGLPLPQGDFRVGDAFSLGWATFKRGYGHLLLCLVIAAGLSLPIIVLSLLAAQLQARAEFTGNQELLAIATACTSFSEIMNYLLGPLVAAGLFWSVVAVIRGEQRIGDVFAGFHRFLGLLGTQILWVLGLFAVVVGLGLVSGLLGAAAVAAMDSGNIAIKLVGLVVIILVIGVGVLALLLWLRVVVAITFSYILLVDPRESVRGGFNVMGVAWRMACHRRGRPMAAVILGGILAFLSVFLFCVGFFFLGMPLYISIVGASYELVRRDIDASKQRLA
ncbi:MAG: hypothetical protein CMJ23_07655 [Phycisphaerae bacterium]|nr:hypothetical protein [Phycisphaerae bacterium]